MGCNAGIPPLKRATPTIVGAILAFVRGEPVVPNQTLVARLAMSRARQLELLRLRPLLTCGVEELPGSR
jgi:hypothetical protein